MESEDIDARYDADETVRLDDGQYFLALLGHHGRGLGKGSFRGDSDGPVGHDLAHGDARALENLPAILLRIAQRDDAAENVQKSRRFNLRILKDQISLGDYPR